MLKKNIQWRLSPLNIALLYILIGGLWILLPGQLLTSLFGEMKTFRRLDTLNHGVFIIITAWILYFLIYHSEAAIKRRQNWLKRSNRALKAFSECNHTLIRATDELELMRDICRTFVEVGGYKLAWVGIAEHNEKKSIRPVAQWGDNSGYLSNLQVSWSELDSCGMGPTGTAIRSSKPVVVQNIQTDPRWALWKTAAINQGFLSSISLPLLHEGRSFAALVILAGEIEAFDSEEVKFLEDLANNLSYGIATLQMDAERKRTETKLHLLASVIEQANEGIILINSEGIIQYVNPSIQAITGYPPSEMVGRYIKYFEEEPHNKEFYESISDALSRNASQTLHYLYTGADGSLFEIDTTSWPVSDQNKVLSSYAVLIRDTTREVQLERQLRLAQKMEAIATLAGGIAHDFNNNLASIITCTEMARDDIPEGTSTRELLDVVLKAGYRGRNLVKQILTISCRGEQEQQPVQVELILDECLKLLRASFPTSIEIEISVDEKLGMVLADPTQIHQIIVNLCTNAAYAMRTTGGILTINLQNIDLDAVTAKDYQNIQPGQYLRITVKDTGHGIDSKTIEKIFDPFFTTKGHLEGTGLGLSVIHGIVKNHKGIITVSSKPGQGATFQVLLPRIDTAANKSIAIEQTVIPTGSERILFIDDEKELAIAEQRMLQRLGYEVTVHTEAQKALDTFYSQPDSFDLVITDQTMPVIKGTELAATIHSIKPSLPIILITGLGTTGGELLNSDNQNKLGIREIVYKPIGQIEFAETIRRVLDQT
jgi:PAS domain S-box-containing protein